MNKSPFFLLLAQTQNFMHIDLAKKMGAIMLKLSKSSLGQVKRCRLHTQEIHNIVGKQTYLRQSDVRQ